MPADGKPAMRFLELKVPPVVVFIICMIGMWAAAQRLPAPGADLPGKYAIAALLFLAAVVAGVRGVIAFRHHGTTVNPHTPGKSASIVTTGIYAYTRNPMYLGLGLGLVAWTVFLGNLAAALGVPVFIVYMNRFQIAPEERVLAEKFGAPYDEYCRRVRRWI